MDCVTFKKLTPKMLRLPEVSQTHYSPQEENAFSASVTPLNPLAAPKHESEHTLNR